MVKVLIYFKMLFIFSTLVLMRHLWQFKTVVFPHWCLMHAVLLSSNPQLHFQATLRSVARKASRKSLASIEPCPMMPSIPDARVWSGANVIKLSSSFHTSERSFLDNKKDVLNRIALINNYKVRKFY